METTALPGTFTHQLRRGSVPQASATCSCGETFQCPTFPLAVAAQTDHAVAALDRRQVAR
jgi:hypothetical protein